LVLAALSLAALAGSPAAASTPTFSTRYAPSLKAQLEQTIGRDVGVKGWPRGTVVLIPGLLYARVGGTQYVIASCSTPATGATDCRVAFERSTPGTWHVYSFKASLLPATCAGLTPFFPRVALVAWKICAGAQAAAAPTAAGTSIHLFSPFRGSQIAPGEIVDKTVSGACTGGSSVTPRATAYGCTAGRQPVDPCFASRPGEAPTFVLCGSPGPDKHVLRINLSRKLPPNATHGSPTRYAPWWVETDSGTWCYLSAGANATVEGLPISYYCTPGSAVLLGAIKRSATGPWTIFLAASSAATRTPLVALRSAWW
jgi:hypothetical protein